MTMWQVKPRSKKWHIYPPTQVGVLSILILCRVQKRAKFCKIQNPKSQVQNPKSAQEELLHSGPKSKIQNPSLGELSVALLLSMQEVEAKAGTAKGQLPAPPGFTESDPRCRPNQDDWNLKSSESSWIMLNPSRGMKMVSITALRNFNAQHPRIRPDISVRQASKQV